MKTVYHEAMHPLGNLGLKISMAALESPHIPMHWHDAMEILFCLNGEVTIQIDHEAFLLSRNQLVVFDSKEMHSIQSASPLYMFLCIHVDKKQMALYCPDLELYHIQCQPLPLDHPKSTEYLTLCQLARDLTRSSIKKESTSTMRSDGIALLMLSDLIQSFSVYAPLGTATGEKKPNDALRVIISYVTEHYPEKITLNDISARIGFSKEYFCRFSNSIWELRSCNISMRYGSPMPGVCSAPRSFPLPRSCTRSVLRTRLYLTVCTRNFTV